MILVIEAAFAAVLGGGVSIRCSRFPSLNALDIGVM